MQIRGKQLLLRDDDRPADDEDLFRWMNLEEWNYLDEPDKAFEAITRDEFDSKLAERRKKPKAPTPGSHTWHVDTAEGAHLGWLNNYHMDPAAGNAKVGICIPEPEYRNQPTSGRVLGSGRASGVHPFCSFPLRVVIEGVVFLGNAWFYYRTFPSSLFRGQWWQHQAAGGLMTTEELDEWAVDFLQFCTRFADVFGRKEPRAQAIKYLRGLLQEQLDGCHLAGTHHLRVGRWDDAIGKLDPPFV